MILIDDNKIISVTATSENVNYPKENLLNSDAKNPWRAASSSASLQIAVESGTTCLGLFGIFGPTTASITYIDSGGSSIGVETQTITRFLNRVVLNWSISGVATVVISMSGGTTVEASILRAGAGSSFPNPRYGLSNGANEHSIIHPYKTGGAYVRDRGRSRVMRGSLKLSLSESAALKEIMAQYGPSPMAVLFDGNDIQEYSMFGSFAMNGTPQETRAFPNHASVGFTLTEFV